ncbi:hypothetical protein ACJJTC_016677 [Scirpophaga incertulas]
MASQISMAAAALDGSCWYVDSGASLHMCNNKNWMYDVSPSTINNIKVADNKTVAVKGSGKEPTVKQESDTDTLVSESSEEEQLYDASSDMSNPERDNDSDYTPERPDNDSIPLRNITLRPRNIKPKPTTYFCYEEKSTDANHPPVARENSHRRASAAVPALPPPRSRTRPRCILTTNCYTTLDGATNKFNKNNTTNTMMTRRATALCTEQKLRQALEELKHTKETCSQLLRERDESEIEIQKIIARNTQTQSELSQLHAQHVDVLQHQENLNETISCYDQQYSSYERTLQRITDLEKELSVANNQIAHYKELEQLQDTVHTENLYQEHIQCSVETGNLKLSKNKFKKYVKVRKYILKTRKLINKEKTYYKNVNFIKERTQLLEKLDILNSTIKENRLHMNKI